MREAHKLGLKCIVSDKNPDCICSKDADLFFPIDTVDVQGHINKALNLAANGVKINGVLAAGIDAPVTMAVLARTLGLPGVDPKIAYIVHNKALLRKKMKELGYPVPKFITLNGPEEAEYAVRKIGLPFIVKNTDSSGSRGTRMFRTRNIPAIKKAITLAVSVSRSKQALIEELWEGPEQTVEVLIDAKGRPQRCFITDRHFDFSRGYAIETGLRQPTSLPPKKQEELYSMIEKFARDMGVSIGAAKGDTMYTKDGPRIIEFTVRLSGGFDSQYLVPAATGKNVLKAAILTALGRTFDPKVLLKDRKKRIGVTGSLWPKPGIIKKIEGIEKAEKIKGIEKIVFRHKPGDRIDPYIDCAKRVCFIIATGKDQSSARKTLESAISAIKVEVE